jgi:two-component system chemotaxis response regulator CheB
MSDQNHKNTPDRVIVIGASAGGFNALIEMLPAFQKMNVAIFVVMHMSPRSSISFMLQHIQLNTVYECRIAANEELIKSGTIFFAPPDNHLIISKGKIIYGKGAYENGFRPSIDTLFRSAAVEYAEKVIGIILSGLLDDGVTGMLMIHRCGGVCIVQDPAEAEYGDMPLNVIAKMQPDHTAPAAAIGNLIMQELKINREKVEPPQEIRIEAQLAEKVNTGINETSLLGDNSNITCPDCGGTLFKIEDGSMTRYRCFTGHAFTEETLIMKQKEQMERTLWVALRIMEERKKMLDKVSGRFSRNSINFLSNTQQMKARDLEFHIQQLKEILFDMQKPDMLTPNIPAPKTE